MSGEWVQFDTYNNSKFKKLIVENSVSKTLNILLATILLLFLFTTSSYAQCGKERWDVKTLIDSDISYIDFNKVIETTVSDQCALPKPTSIKKNRD